MPGPHENEPFCHGHMLHAGIATESEREMMMESDWTANSPSL